MAEARPIPESPESSRRSPQPHRATALVAALVTVLVAVFYGRPHGKSGGGWQGRARKPGGPERWRRHLRPRDRAWPGSVSLDLTRAFPGDSPADPGSPLQCKAGESTAGRPGLNREFPGIPAKGRGRKAPSGRGGRRKAPARPPRPPARGARGRHEGGRGSKKRRDPVRACPCEARMSRRAAAGIARRDEVPRRLRSPGQGSADRGRSSGLG